MEKIPMTQPGFTRLEQELKTLKSVERPAVIEAIAEARAHGDLSENAEYSAARERQSFIEGRILELEDKLSRADVIDTSKIVSAHIQFGAHVHLVDEDTEIEVKYQIVSDYEANIDHGRISTSAPIARALIGKTIGESVEVHTPRGLKAYEVLLIVYE